MALFTQYAMAAAEEALADSKWRPANNHDREATVSHVNVSIERTAIADSNSGRLSGIWHRQFRRRVQHLSCL